MHWAHLPRRLEDRRQVEVSGLGSTEALVDLEHVCTPDHLVDGPEAKLRHVPAELFCEIVKEVDDVLRLACELGTKLRVLRGDTDGAGVH